MKKENNPTLHDKNNATNPTPAGNAPVQHVFTLGLDVDLVNVVTAIQCDRGRGRRERAREKPGKEKRAKSF